MKKYSAHLRKATESWQFAEEVEPQRPSRHFLGGERSLLQQQIKFNEDNPRQKGANIKVYPSSAIDYSKDKIGLREEMGIYK